MKKLTIPSIIFLCIAFLFNGCQKMEDIHKEYLKDGDKIYSPKPLTIKSFAGQKRVKLKYYLVNATNVNKCVVEWDEGKGSQSVDISPKVPLDSIEVMIGNLEERSYIFKVYTTDKNGNRSVKEQITGSSYDQKYRAGLTNRSIIDISGGGTTDSITIRWGTPVAGNTSVEIAYLNTSGVTVKKKVPSTDGSTVIRGWKSESEMSLKSYYIPEPTAIDTFISDVSKVILPAFIEFKGEKLNKSKWKIVNFSTQEPAEGAPNGLASAAIDDNLNTFWHTQWSGANPGYPHHFTVDLNDIVKISKIECFRRKNDNRGQTKFQIYTSLDGTNFTLQGTYSYDPNLASQVYNISSLPLARYVKYVATEGQDFFAFLAELDIYGQNASEISKKDWTISSFSTEEPAEANWGPPIQGRAAAAIDGDLTTFWHSQWDEAQPGYPHWFVVDMKQKVKILAVECFRRQNNNNGQTKFKIYTSNDGINFTPQGEFSFNSKINAGQMYGLKNIPEARYIKYEATEGPDHYAFLAEFKVYGKLM